MMTLPRRPRLNPGVITALAVAAIAGTLATSAEPDRLPDRPVRDLGGEPMALEAPEGGALAVVFLWSECPISNQYSPELNAIAEGFADRGLRLVGLFVDEDKTDEAIARHAEDYDLRFPVGRGGGSAMAQAAGVETVPSVILTDEGGDIRYRGRINDQFFAIGRKRQVTRTDDLRDAAAAVLEGRPVATPRTEAVGCSLPEYGDDE